MSDDLVTLPRADVLGLLAEIESALDTVDRGRDQLLGSGAATTPLLGPAFVHVDRIRDILSIARDLVEGTPGEPRSAADGPCLMLAFDRRPYLGLDAVRLVDAWHAVKAGRAAWRWQVSLSTNPTLGPADE